MTLTELLNTLNDQARGLEVGPISQRELRGWVDRGLIKPAVPHGRRRGHNPVWHYGTESVEAARKLIGLKKLGIARTSALQVHLFANGFDFPGDTVRTALLLEFERLLKRQQRRDYWDGTQSHFADLTPVNERKLMRYKRQRDLRLEKTGIPLESNFLLQFVQNAYSGQVDENALTSDALSLWLGGPLTPGLLSMPEYSEASALARLHDVTYEELVSARCAFLENCIAVTISIGVFGLPAGDAENLMVSLSHGDWLILTLASMAAEVRRRRTNLP